MKLGDYVRITRTVTEADTTVEAPAYGHVCEELNDTHVIVEFSDQHDNVVLTVPRDALVSATSTGFDACIYWLRQDDHTGLCRCNPPVPVLVPPMFFPDGSVMRNESLESVFPTMRVSGWCGSFTQLVGPNRA
jgi:hypothetical protein